MEEHSNGKVEETQKEETHGNGVETVKELFEELKSEVLHAEEAVLGKDSSSESSSSDEEEERTELVEEALEPVSDPVEVVSSDMTQELEVSDPVEVVSSDMTQEVEIPVEDDSKDTNAVEQEAEEPMEKPIELESEDVVEKEGIEQIALPSEETEVPPESDGNMGQTSEVEDKKEDDDSLRPSVDVPAVDNGNKAEISTEPTRTSPIISISSRTIQPTSWRSCCGLFEVLRRNK